MEKAKSQDQNQTKHPGKANNAVAKAKPKAFDLAELQSRLAKLPIYRDKPDGQFGTETREAVQASLASAGISGWQNWSKDRLLVAGQQAICAFDGIDVGAIDGLAGPQTRFAIEVYEARLNGAKEPENWRDEDTTPAGQVHANASQDWPRQKDCLRFFGKPGENQTRLAIPYPVRLAWDTKTIVRSTLVPRKSARCGGACSGARARSLR